MSAAFEADEETAERFYAFARMAPDEVEGPLSDVQRRLIIETRRVLLPAS